MVFSLDEDSESIVPEVQAEKEWSLGTQAAKTVNEEIAKGNPVIFRWSDRKKNLKWASICFHSGKCNEARRTWNNSNGDRPFSL